MKHRFRSRHIRNIAGLLLFPVVLFVMFRWFEHKQVYFPMSRMDAEHRVLGPSSEDVYFAAADGVRLNGWFFPAAAAARRGNTAILICHGNAGNISHRVELCDLLLQMGVAVFVFDYRGYGRSEGTPSEEGTYLDAVAAHQWLVKKGFAATNVMVLGESLGGAVAAELATRVPVGAIMLQSTFTSIPALGAELFPWLPVKLICSIRYDTLSKLPAIRVPVLVVHSRGDSIIGYHHGEKNFAAAKGPKMFCEIFGDHNDWLVSDVNTYRSGIEKFLSRLETEAAQSNMLGNSL